MFDGPAVAAALKGCGVTHVVWIPDSDLGRWNDALSADPDLELVRVCREGEGIAVAAGLYLGGQRPVVIIQCTGLFEAGDALRNAVHDMKLPLFLVVGVRNYYTHQKGTSADSCPVFAEPIVQAWQLPYRWLTKEHGPADLATAYREAWEAKRAGVVLLAE
jgi:sulfopyruvate decarboxylase subunit alpha